MNDAVRAGTAQPMDARTMELQARYEALAAEFKNVRRQITAEVKAEAEAKSAEAKARDRAGKEITRNVKAINNMIIGKDKMSHVPDSLLRPMIKLVSSMMNDSFVFNGAELRELRDGYAALKNATHNVDYQNSVDAYDEDVMDLIDDMERMLDGRGLRRLTTEELQTVNAVIGSLRHMVDGANEVLRDGHKTRISDIGNEELARFGRLKYQKGGKLKEEMKRFLSKNVTPIFMARRIGGYFEETVKRLSEGQLAFMKIVRLAKEKYAAAAEKYHLTGWEHQKEKLSFETEKHQKIELDVMTALNLYTLAKREEHNRWQKANHLQTGGVVYTPEVKLDDTTIQTRKPIKLEAPDIERIKGWLTEDQKGFADALVRIMSEDMAQYGNEVSNRLAGYSAFGEDYYVPYVTDSGARRSSMATGLDSDKMTRRAIKNMGFTKALTRHANTALVIDDMRAVFTNHINQMATYCAFAEALDDFDKVANYAIDDGDNSKTTWRQAARAAYGDDVVRYINQFIVDMCGGPASTERLSVDRLVSKFKGAAVGMNLRVMIQQASAFPRAMALISPKHFAPIGVKKAMRNWRQAMDYSGAVAMKDMGRFDMSMGFTVGEYIRKDSEQAANAGEWIMQKGNELSGWGPENMDKITWGYIWEACKREQREKTGADGKELLRLTGKRMDEVCNMTQVYDSVMVKSEAMRSKNSMDKMLTAFMAEPTLTANLLIDAITNRNKQDIKNHVSVKRAGFALMTAMTLNAILASIISALRDKDPDKTYVEKYIKELEVEFLEGLNPMGYLPVAKDVMSLLQGYDVARSDMSVISNLIKEMEKVFADSTTLEDRLQNIATMIGQVSGIPIGNLWRDTEAIINTATGRTAKPLSETSGTAIRYMLKEGIG